jgi:hypothetical protein
MVKKAQRKLGSLFASTRLRSGENKLNIKILSGWPRSRFWANDEPAARKGGRNALLGSSPSTNPDFLWSLVGSLHFMRLSLKKGAHVVLSRAAYRKSGESTGAPSFALFAKGGIVRSHPLTSHGKQTCSF